ncbi:class F sortase [Alkalicoccus luteus]|uniref:class F sortase n=1 Tax=Alkalicoccus luteus TaxID=1237094 RepID=UPI0040339816
MSPESPMEPAVSEEVEAEPGDADAEYAPDSETASSSESNEPEEHAVSEEENDPEENQAEETVEDVQEAEPIQPVLGGTSSGMEPVRIEIPAIDVDAVVDGYGLNEEGQMAVPDEGETVAWFNRGAKPGAQGNSVLAGHVDDYEGPAVFYDLKELEPGDSIHLYDEDGEQMTFIVQSMESYPYEDAPVDQVFGGTASRNLNLITCTGEFDRNVGTHRERLVVYTELEQ